MKTAVSIPDALFEQADRLAHRLGKSRSQLYREALAEYLARRDSSEITAALNEVADELGDEDRRWIDATTREMLERTEW